MLSSPHQTDVGTVMAAAGLGGFLFLALWKLLPQMPLVAILVALTATLLLVLLSPAWLGRPVAVASPH